MLQIAAIGWVFVLTSSAAVAVPEVQVVREGLIEAFPAREDKTFESSAVIVQGDGVWVSSDKAAAGTKLSSVIRVPLEDLLEEGFLAPADTVPVFAPEFRHTQKIESFAAGTEGWSFACTSFDRLDPKIAPHVAFNCLLAWPGGAMDEARVLHPRTDAGRTSSVELRPHFAKALASSEEPEGPAYFKIEGLAALPGKRLWFGVREIGKTYEDFQYTFRIIEARWSEKDGSVVLDPGFRVVFDATQEEMKVLGIDRVAGLSSLEFDPHREIVWATASWEEGEHDGAWLLAITDPLNKPTLHAVPATGAGGVLGFPHKVEGLAVVDEETLLTVSDEDRRTPFIQGRQREMNMAVWSVLKVADPSPSRDEE